MELASFAKAIPIKLGELERVRRAAWQQGRDAPPLGADDFGAFEGNTYSEYGLSDDSRRARRAGGTAEVHAQVAMSVLVRTIAKAVR